MNSLLLISTANCFLELLAPIVIKFLTDLFYTEHKVDQSLRTDLLNIKHEIASISMVDEFSKYAKLQRKYNKMETELKSNVNTRLASRMKSRLLITYGFRIINALAIVVMLYMYRHEPVAVLPENALWPFQNIFSWPCVHQNSVSLAVWVIITRLVVSVCK